MNIELLKKVRDTIKARPGQFVMRHFFSNMTEKGAPASHCGTAACIGGWAVALDRSLNPDVAWEVFSCNDIAKEAQIALGLDYSQAARLFNKNNWPVKFREETAKNDKEFADIAAERIDYFIENGR